MSELSPGTAEAKDMKLAPTRRGSNCVGTSSGSFTPAQAQGLSPFAAPPFPVKTMAHSAPLGFDGAPTIHPTNGLTAIRRDPG